MATTKSQTGNTVTKTIAEQHVRGLQATEMELGQTEAALQQMNQQMRAMNARRQRLIEGRATILRLLGLDPDTFYKWTPAKQAGRLVPVEITQEEIDALVKAQREPQSGPKVADAAPIAPASPTTSPGKAPAQS